jgi:8-amino-7-oxononanoate synthase
MAKKPGLDTSARDKLRARVQNMQQSDKGRDAAAAATKARWNTFTDFKTLPGFEEIRMQKTFGERFGIDNPYFKMHDGLASSRTSIGGREYVNFSCYDYLSLNGHPEIVTAAKSAIDKFGISCSGSRVVAGERIVHQQLEKGLAQHYGVEDALLFVSGYGTNVCVIGQMVGAKDLVIFDSMSHNSIVTGGVMSGATRRSFPHNDLDALAQQLEQMRDRYERVMIVVEGHYSMDGDYPDLPRLLEIKEKYGCWLMVDEAHSLGVLGATGHGVQEVFGIDPKRVDIWMGTLSKTLVGAGGYVAGSAVMVDFLRSLGGAFVYSVAVPSVIAASAEKALTLMHREPERVQKLQANAKHFAKVAMEKGLSMGTSMQTAICPVIVGDSLPAAMLSDRMFKRGINVQPVLYPGVPPKTSRLRFFLNTSHTFEDIELALDAVVEELKAIDVAIKDIPLRI